MHLRPDWYAALTAVAERTWEVLMRHPWALQSLASAPAGPNAMRHVEQSLAALAGTDLDPAAKFAVLAVVDDYVHGNVVRAAEYRAATATPVDEEAHDAAVRFAEAQYATGEFPHTRALFGGKDPRAVLPKLLGGASVRDRFRKGLAMLLDGTARRMHLDRPES